MVHNISILVEVIKIIKDSNSAIHRRSHISPLFSYKRKGHKFVANTGQVVSFIELFKAFIGVGGRAVVALSLNFERQQCDSLIATVFVKEHWAAREI